MRTTLDLNDKLIKDAMKIAHVETKTRVITIALQELIRKFKISELKKFKGKIDIELDLDMIRDR